jgi:hypothetical protein
LGERLRVGYKQFSRALTGMSRVNKQGLNCIVRETEETDDLVRLCVENPPAHSRTRELLRDEWSQVQDVIVGEKPVRRAYRSFPQRYEWGLVF